MSLISSIKTLLAPVLTLSIMITCHSCKPTDGSSFDYNSSIVSDVVSNHEATIVFVWTKWCQASQNTFERDVIPYLNEPIGNVGLVLIHFGEIDEIPDSITNNQIVMNSRSLGGADKIISNIRFKRIFKGYHNQDIMPMSILVDSNGVVLNYLPDNQRYTFFNEIIWSLKQGNYNKN
ncbi:MAG: hypothetical protein MJZ97_03065 [Bacteroidales bacterium]|nr:hypothetical protein [Bacteroidales bacterium]